MGKGTFITFEGLDRSGKTTQISLLEKHLISIGAKVIITREPGGTSVGEKLREMLLDIKEQGITYTTEVLLYAASRAQHVNDVIKPALSRGDIVICDRYIDSTVAYQGFGCGLNLKDLDEINRIASCGVFPDITVFIDVSVEESINRIKQRAGLNSRASTSRAHTGIDRIEDRGRAFFDKVKKGYEYLAQSNPERIVKVNGQGREIEDVHNSIVQLIDRRLIKRGLCFETNNSCCPGPGC